MKIPVVSPKYGRYEVIIDDEDFKKVKNLHFYLHKAGQFLYVRFGIKNKQYLHRFITNAPKDKVVDHINRNTLDNRKINLRVCTIQENLRNQKRPNSKTGYTGVAIAYKGKYSAQIKINYKKIHLGIFNTIEEALKARRLAEKQYYETKSSSSI